MKTIKNIIVIIGIVAMLTAGIYGYNYYVTVEELENTQQELIGANESYIELNNVFEATNDELETTKNELENANEIVASKSGETYFVDCEVTQYEIDMIAKTVWGEARGCNKLEQSAVVWCILNRVDAGYGTIAQVITAPNQFHGYSSGFPVTDDIKALTEDVVARWKLEKIICGDVGRTLPSNYLYFAADDTGIGNVFRTAWSGNYEVWNWDCWNPYA